MRADSQSVEPRWVIRTIQFRPDRLPETGRGRELTKSPRPQNPPCGRADHRSASPDVAAGCLARACIEVRWRTAIATPTYGWPRDHPNGL